MCPLPPWSHPTSHVLSQAFLFCTEWPLALQPSCTSCLHLPIPCASFLLPLLFHTTPFPHCLSLPLKLRSKCIREEKDQFHARASGRILGFSVPGHLAGDCWTGWEISALHRSPRAPTASCAHHSFLDQQTPLSVNRSFVSWTTDATGPRRQVNMVIHVLSHCE